MPAGTKLSVMISTDKGFNHVVNTFMTREQIDLELMKPKEPGALCRFQGINPVDKPVELIIERQAIYAWTIMEFVQQMVDAPQRGPGRVM